MAHSPFGMKRYYQVFSDTLSSSVNTDKNIALPTGWNGQNAIIVGINAHNKDNNYWYSNNAAIIGNIRDDVLKVYTTSTSFTSQSIRVTVMKTDY